MTDHFVEKSSSIFSKGSERTCQIELIHGTLHFRSWVRGWIELFLPDTSLIQLSSVTCSTLEAVERKLGRWQGPMWAVIQIMTNGEQNVSSSATCCCEQRFDRFKLEEGSDWSIDRWWNNFVGGYQNFSPFHHSPPPSAHHRVCPLLSSVQFPLLITKV